MRLNNQTNGYYTIRQLKLPLEIEKLIDISDLVYTFCEVMNHIDLSRYFVEKGCKTGRPRCDEQKLLKVIQMSLLEPMIVYLKNDDVEKQIQETAKERAGWLEAVIDYHINGGYGKSISACGFDGYILCLKERQKRELEYLEKSKVNSVIIENAHRNWEQTYKMLDDLIV